MNLYSDINNSPQQQGEELQEPNPPQQQNEISDIQNSDEKYCGGLLNRSDHILIKVLKLILAVPLLPLVLAWRLLYCTANLIYDCFTNQLYNCLLYLYGKIVVCLMHLSHVIQILFNYCYRCLAYICNTTLQIIYFFGRYSKYILDWYAIFIISLIFKFAHLRSIIQEFTSIITIPLSLKIIVPLALCFYHKIYCPTKNAIIFILKKSFHILKITIIHIYNFTINYLLIPFYEYIILNVFYLLRFLLIKVLYETIIINLFKGIRWSIVNFYTFILLNLYEYLIVKFLYEIILTYSYKAMNLVLYKFLYKLVIVPIFKAVKWLLIDFLYEIIIIKTCQFLRFIIVDVIYMILSKLADLIYNHICVNIYRCSTWIIKEIVYNLLIRNIYVYFLKPLYNILVITIKCITKNIKRFILVPLWNLSKSIYKCFITIISSISKFIYYQLLTPVWKLIVVLTKGLLNLIKNMFTATRQLSIDMWIATKNLVRRLRNIF